MDDRSSFLERVIGLLAEHGIRYRVIGGVGVNAYCLDGTFARGELTAGAVWRARFVPVRVPALVASGEDELGKVVRLQTFTRGRHQIGVEYAAALGADVINWSMGAVYFERSGATAEFAGCQSADRLSAEKLPQTRAMLEEEAAGLETRQSLVVMAIVNCPLADEDTPAVISWSKALQAANENVIVVASRHIDNAGPAITVVLARALPTSRRLATDSLSWIPRPTTMGMASARSIAPRRREARSRLLW